MSQGRRILQIAALVLGLFLTVRFHELLAARTAPPPPPADPQRIITLAPSVTETVYALGLGSRVAGVTKYCAYPPEVLAKPKAATFSEINFEAIIRLKADLIILPQDKTYNAARLQRLGLPVISLDTGTLEGFREGVSRLGASFGRTREAGRILSLLDRSIADAQKAARGRSRPRVLFSVMHNYEGLGYITEINAVGRDGFYDRIISLAGADNVCPGRLAFPRLSREAIIFLNPDIIVDIILDTKDLEAVRADWSTLSSVKAVQNGQIHFLTQQSDTVPGPRIYQTIDRLSAIFHPPDSAGSSPETAGPAPVFPGGLPKASESAPAGGIPEASEPAPADGNPKASDSVPADGNPKASESVPADGNLKASEPAPAGGNPKDSEPAPSAGITNDLEPASPGGVPRDLEPASPNGNPRNLEQAPAPAPAGPVSLPALELSSDRSGQTPGSPAPQGTHDRLN
ncbi:MAG: ABC transporter substrate-binding protein [Deltaproteobacteria bacterium]|jgi:iron complex transport system substrate-binding protein|nr:ABC transporter substrate-binding protein [Deltaproteobacteria bacterium]